MASWKNHLAVAVIMIVLLGQLSSGSAKEIPNALEDSMDEAKVRVRRGEDDCMEKCKGMGKNGGKCESTWKPFCSETCDACFKVCTCY